MRSVSKTGDIGIAFLCSFPMVNYRGGVATITITLCRELLQRGFHVIFVAVCPNYKIDSEYAFETSQYYIDSSLDKEEIAHRLNELLLEEEIQCVINMATYLSFFDLLKSIPSNIVKISTLERKPYETDGIERMMLNRWYPTSVKGFLWKLLGITIPLVPRLFYNHVFSKQYSRAIEASDYYVVLSEKYKEILQKKLENFNKEKVVVISNPNTFPMPKKVTKEKKVLFCGRLDNQCKNVSDLLKAWRLVENHRNDWCLEIVGDGEDSHHLKTLASRLELNKVRFCGFVENKDSFFGTSSIICVPSLYEGWCTVLTEGMINRCVPVVYDTFQSAHDIIVHQNNGFFVEQNNYKNLASILIKLMSESKLDVYGEKAALAVSEYTPSNIVDKWVEVIQKEDHKSDLQ